MIFNQIEFPEFKGIRCNMMPFIQGDSDSLPKEFRSYADIVDNNYLEKGEIGYLTIDESYVEAGRSQRGYNSEGIDRNVHIEVGHCEEYKCWGPVPTWRGKPNVILDEDTEVLIGNNISDTCRVWDAIERSYTEDGDLSRYIDRYPEHTGILLKKGELAKISIFTPHECIDQKVSGDRQFFRIVGKGVHGKEYYFTRNPILE